MFKHFLFVLCIILPMPVYSGACAELTAADKSRLASYVAKRFGVADAANLRFERDEVQSRSCYHKLTFRGVGVLGPYPLTLFASPDLRYLSRDVFDTSIDPSRERLETATVAMAQLPDGEHAERGRADAASTLVVFSDFQCPFCKKMADELAHEPLLNSPDLRVVFRHMPLSVHNWAQAGAEAAACAQFQNVKVFWDFHNSLFESQASITTANVHARILELASKIDGLDLQRFRTCVDNQVSLGVVLRDKALARHLGVEGAPALFLNDVYLSGVRGADDLHRVLSEVLNSHVAPGSPPTIGYSRVAPPPKSAEQPE